jgi:drug/metabolite transporter (DMT)-like permease
MNYLQLLWAGLLGLLVFNHVPDMLSIVGMLVITASGAMIALKSRPTKAKLQLENINE